MDKTTLLSRRTNTLDTGRRKVEVPIDVLGRERWRARMDNQRVEARAEGDLPTADFYGHAALFNKRTWIGPRTWGFWELVAPGAFDKTINDSDCRFLINHDPNLLLARNKAGTLKLSVDDSGLVTEAPGLDRRQSYTNDVVISLERGDITQMSFAFEVVKESWEILDDDSELRTIEEVKLWDVSVVTYPAYEDTDAGLRAAAFEALCRSAGIDEDGQNQLMHQIAGAIETPVVGQAPPADTPEPGSSTRAADSQPGSSTGDSPRSADLRLRERIARI